MKGTSPNRNIAVTAKAPGDKGYPDAFIAQVRLAWATGEFGTDKEIAQVFGMARKETVSDWRHKAAPDGIPWEQFKTDLNRASLDVVAQRLGESNAEATLRHIKVIRASQTTVARYIFGQRLELADGTFVTLPSVQPKSLGEAINAYVTLVKMERHMRGEPDVRVDHYLHLIGEVVARVALSFIQEVGLPESKLTRFKEMFETMLQTALDEQQNQLLPAAPATDYTDDDD